MSNESPSHSGNAQISSTNNGEDANRMRRFPLPPSNLSYEELLQKAKDFERMLDEPDSDDERETAAFMAELASWKSDFMSIPDYVASPRGSPPIPKASSAEGTPTKSPRNPREKESSGAPGPSSAGTSPQTPAKVFTPKPVVHDPSHDDNAQNSAKAESKDEPPASTKRQNEKAKDS